MSTRMVRARAYCARCGQYSRWFPCAEDGAGALITVAWEKHRERCGRRAA